MKPDIPDFVVYKVQNQFKYYFDDENPQIIREGIYFWQARNLIRELDKQPRIPLNPSGYPQCLYKYCRKSEWDKYQRIRQAQAINLFD